MSPYVLPGTPFDVLLGQYGVNLLWLQSNQCACVYGGDMPGSPDPDCTSCHGRGVYWNPPVGPFQGLITYATMAPGDREPGVYKIVNIVNGKKYVGSALRVKQRWETQTYHICPLCPRMYYRGRLSTCFWGNMVRLRFPSE